MIPVIFSDRGRYPHEIRDLTIEESQAVIAVFHFVSLLIALKVIWFGRYELVGYAVSFTVWLASTP